MAHTTPEKIVPCPLRKNVTCSASDCLEGYNCMFHASAAAQTIIEEHDQATAPELVVSYFDGTKIDPEVLTQFVTEVLRQVQSTNN